jgi:hypothetical protein
MKKILFTLCLALATPLFSYEFRLTPEKTADGCGKFEIFNYYNGKSCVASLRTPSIQFAMRSMVRKATFLGMKLCIIGWDLKGKIYEEVTPCFDTSDFWFRTIRSNLLGNYSQHRTKQFTFLSPTGQIIGCGFFLGPGNIGITDASTILQTMAGSDG